MPASASNQSRFTPQATVDLVEVPIEYPQPSVRMCRGVGCFDVATDGKFCRTCRESIDDLMVAPEPEFDCDRLIAKEDYPEWWGRVFICWDRVGEFFKPLGALISDIWFKAFVVVASFLVLCVCYRLAHMYHPEQLKAIFSRVWPDGAL